MTNLERRHSAPACASPGASVDEQSIWKKEISFGRKRKNSQPEPEETTAESSPSEPTSIWKKEISFGKKKKHAEASNPVEDESEVVADGSGEVQRSDPEPGPEETGADEQVWTRAVSFGRKQADAPDTVVEETPQLEAVEDEAEVVADASGEVQGSDPEPGPEATVPVPVEAVADGAALVADSSREAEVVVDASGEVQGSDPEPSPEETAPEEQTWTKEVSFSRTTEPEPEPVAAAPVEQIAPEVPTETWSATPVLPPQPEPVVVHPPVPAAELPPARAGSPCSRRDDPARIRARRGCRRRRRAPAIPGAGP